MSLFTSILRTLEQLEFFKLFIFLQKKIQRKLYCSYLYFSIIFYDWKKKKRRKIKRFPFVGGGGGIKKRKVWKICNMYMKRVKKTDRAKYRCRRLLPTEFRVSRGRPSARRFRPENDTVNGFRKPPNRGDIIFHTWPKMAGKLFSNAQRVILYSGPRAVIWVTAAVIDTADW